MSTTTIPFVLPSFQPPPPSTGPATSPLSDTSTLLFGFLVSALSIFAAFMTCAIVWNRLVSRRRVIDAMLAMGGPLDPQRIHRPAMWDVRAMLDKEPRLWSDVKPVAAQICDCLPSSPQREETTSFWRRHIWDRLPPEITYLFHRPSPTVPSASSDTNIELMHGSNIQISLLISMPHTPQSALNGKREDRHVFREMVFATTTVFCHDPS